MRKQSARKTPPAEPKPEADARFIHEITLRNFLSFGPETPPLELRPLNVLIGPNGSGKSNFIEAFSLLRALPRDVQRLFGASGGVTEWIWKGDARSAAQIQIVAAATCGSGVLVHGYQFIADAHRFRLQHEELSVGRPLARALFTTDRDGEALVSTGPNETRTLRPPAYDPNSSILAQLRDPERLPEITYLADTYPRIAIYREWAFGRHTVFRTPQPADARNDRLEDDCSNLGMFLSRLRRDQSIRKALTERLRDVYADVVDFDLTIEGGTVQLFLIEQGASGKEWTIPATRLSDGTLRYLCLLAILLDPKPPPLICIEEPELGLHPDLLPKLADLMVEASARTQLIVTTHSDIIVDALSEQPESVIVCEKHDGQTRMKRLDAAELKVWLQKFSLGELWISGELGGRRW